uniref:Uncharacterized protein n=1 Tax=Anolis carolinensis TaxID=28377 RepID=A0A803SKU7_ANOCA
SCYIFRNLFYELSRPILETKFWMDQGVPKELFFSAASKPLFPFYMCLLNFLPIHPHQREKSRQETKNCCKCFHVLGKQHLII